MKRPRLWGAFQTIGPLLSRARKLRAALTLSWKRASTLSRGLLKPLGEIAALLNLLPRYERVAIKGVALATIFGLAGLILIALPIYRGGPRGRFLESLVRIIPYPAVLVGTSPISFAEIGRETDFIIHYGRATGRGLPSEVELRSQVEAELVRARRIEQGARQSGIRVRRSDVEATWQRISRENGGRDRVRTLLAELYGMDEGEFRRLIRRRLYEEKVRTDLLENARVAHLLIRWKRADGDRREWAKARIWEIRAEIEQGLPFEEAAKKYSEDEATASKEGDLGVVSRGQLPKSVEEVVFQIPPTSLSEPIFSEEFGWHLVLVRSRRGKIAQNFDAWYQEQEKHFKVRRLAKTL